MAQNCCHTWQMTVGKGKTWNFTQLDDLNRSPNDTTGFLCPAPASSHKININHPLDGCHCHFSLSGKLKGCKPKLAMNVLTIDNHSLLWRIRHHDNIGFILTGLTPGALSHQELCLFS